MPANIFINYRKDDSRWNTHALYKELQKYFSEESIFKDFNTIGLGEDYLLSINAALEQCDVLLVVIGRSWLDIRNSQGELRLHDKNDLVRIEIAVALKRGIKVIPVLFDDVQMIAEVNLPEELRPLTRRQYISVSDVKFESDVEKLASAIKEILNHPHANSIEGPKKDSEIVTNPEHTSTSERLIRAVVSGIVGAFVATIACFIVISVTTVVVDKHDAPFEQATRCGLISGLCWILPGLLLRKGKKALLNLAIGAVFGFGIWLLLARAISHRTDSDLVTMAIAFGMPIGSLFAVFTEWLKRKK